MKEKIKQKLENQVYALTKEYNKYIKNINKAEVDGRRMSAAFKRQFSDIRARLKECQLSLARENKRISNRMRELSLNTKLRQREVENFVVLGVNTTGGYNETLMHWAVLSKNYPIVLFLAEHDVNYNIRNSEGRTSICYAAEILAKQHKSLSKLDKNNLVKITVLLRDKTGAKAKKSTNKYGKCFEDYVDMCKGTDFYDEISGTVKLPSLATARSTSPKRKETRVKKEGIEAEERYSWNLGYSKGRRAQKKHVADDDARGHCFPTGALVIIAENIHSKRAEAREEDIDFINKLKTAAGIYKSHKKGRQSSSLSDQVPYIVIPKTLEIKINKLAEDQAHMRGLEHENDFAAMFPDLYLKLFFDEIESHKDSLPESPKKNKLEETLKATWEKTVEFFDKIKRCPSSTRWGLDAGVDMERTDYRGTRSAKKSFVERLRVDIATAGSDGPLSSPRVTNNFMLSR